MKRRTFIRHLLYTMRILVLILLCIRVGNAEEIARFQPERVAFLIEQLASKNPVPEEVHRGVDRPKNYDNQLQVPVYLAMRQLLNEGSAACDGLCDYFDDKRYSYTYNGTNGDFYRSVGFVSQDLFQSILCPYQHEIHFITRDQLNLGLGAEKNLRAWWKSHREHPLWQLQLEQIELAIKYFSSVRTETAATIHPDAGRFEPEKFEKLRLENLEHLQALKSSINALKKPHVTQSVESHGSAFTGLPWHNKSYAKTGFNRQ